MAKSGCATSSITRLLTKSSPSAPAASTTPICTDHRMRLSGAPTGRAASRARAAPIRGSVRRRRLHVGEQVFVGGEAIHQLVVHFGVDLRRAMPPAVFNEGPDDPDERARDEHEQPAIAQNCSRSCQMRSDGASRSDGL